MTTPVHRRDTAAAEAATPDAGYCRPADLHAADHVNNVRRGAESPMNSRQQPQLIFTYGSAAGDHHQRDFAVADAWSPRCYVCSFCGREFKSAQALGGHMNIHRRDRARLRTCTASLSHPDLPPSPQNTHKSGYSTLLPFEAAYRDNATSISSTFNLLHMPSAATEPLPHQSDTLAASFSTPISDLVSFSHGSIRSSSVASFSQVQDGASCLCPNLASHKSSRNSSFKHAEEMEVLGQASNRQFRLDCGEYTSPQNIQASETEGRSKRQRGNVLCSFDLDAVKSSSGDYSCTGKRCGEAGPSTTENFNPLHTATAPDHCSSARRTPADAHHHTKELNCLDLELRLGQSCLAPGGDRI